MASEKTGLQKIIVSFPTWVANKFFEKKCKAPMPSSEFVAIHSMLCMLPMSYLQIYRSFFYCCYL